MHEETPHTTIYYHSTMKWWTLDPLNNAFGFDQPYKTLGPSAIPSSNSCNYSFIKHVKGDAKAGQKHLVITNPFSLIMHKSIVGQTNQKLTICKSSEITFINSKHL